MANTGSENFRKAFTELKSYCAVPIQDNRDRAGIIQAFEFTFEQAWKAIQKAAGSVGTEVAYPKQAFSFAMQSGWIKQSDEPKWTTMIKDRNLTSHTYKQELANEVLSHILNDYLNLFAALLQSLETLKN